MSDYLDDMLDEPPTRSVVRWMDRPPMSVSPAALSGAVAGAFVLGAAAVLAVMAITGRITVRQVGNRTSRLLH
ncbi:hypothetical protein [Phenylobacterium sp.]|uniref:hypothetical protein n=1 Tax=Phenylobacterium sp. TaxID=1871053 RepID=UPI0035B142B0